MLNSLGVAGKPRWWRLIVWNSGGCTNERNSQIRLLILNLSTWARPAPILLAVVFTDLIAKLIASLQNLNNSDFDRNSK